MYLLYRDLIFKDIFKFDKYICIIMCTLLLNCIIIITLKLFLFVIFIDIVE